MSATTAAELRAQADAADAAAEASFQRCDTDGFLSQWALGIGANRDRLQAEIVENNGRSDFPALFDLAGSLVPAKLICGQYGMVWGILASDDPDSRFTGWFSPSNAENPKRERTNNAKKGYYVGRVMARAKADILGGGRGLSGCASAYAGVKRIDGGFSRDVVVIDNGQEG